MESRAKALERELTACFDDWCGDFDVDIESEGPPERFEYFSVVISHKSLGADLSATARVDGERSCEIDFGDFDSWESITKANVFAALWFNEAAKRAA